MNSKFFLTAVLSIISVAVFADGPVLPQKWNANKSDFSIADNVITVKAKGSTSGIRGVITNAVKQRYKVSFDIKGQGQAQAALSGSTGMAYSPLSNVHSKSQ